MKNISNLSEWVELAIADLKGFRWAIEDKLYLVSYPKCGATWLQFMLVQIVVNSYKIDMNNLSISFADLPLSKLGLPYLHWTHDGSSFLFEDGTRLDPKPLFIYGGRLRYRKSRVILLARDPRDVIVSHYHHATKRSVHPLEIRDLSDFVHHPLYGFRRIIRFYRLWNWNRWVPKNLMIVRYEDLINRGIATIENIVKFIKINKATKKIIEDVYNYSNADNMRKLELSGKIKGMKVFTGDANSLKVRKAKIGSYRDELSTEDINYCNKMMHKIPKIYGYSV